MSSIDNRIVNMEFNNAKFMSGVRETTGALDGLKKTLQMKDAPKNLGDVEKGLTSLSDSAKKISFQAVADNIQSVSDKFSILGAVGFTVIQDLTNTVLGFAKKISGVVLDPLLEGGKRRAQNIEQANFMFEGLGINIEKAMEAANYAVKGTAFGLDEAARAAAQLSASKVPLDKLGDALRGISGVAAMTNSGYSEISEVFTTVAGNGRLMASELNRISSRGLNAASALATYLNVSESEVREMTSKGKIDFETFAAAMDQAFGEQATKANKIYSGSLANVRAALSRIGASYFAPKLESMRKIFNALAPAIDEVHEVLKPLLKVFSEGFDDGANGLVTMIEKLTKGITNLRENTDFVTNLETAFKNLYDLVKTIRDVVASAFKDIFGEVSADPLVAMSEAIRDFTEWLKIGERTADNLKRTFRGLFAAFDIFGMVISSVVKILTRVFNAIFGGSTDVTELTGNVGDLIVRFRDFLKSGGSMEKVAQKIGDALVGVVDVVKTVIRTLKSFFDLIKTFAFDGFAAGWDLVKKAFERFVDSFNPLKKLIEGTITAFNGFMKVMKAVKKFLQPLLDWIGQAFSLAFEKVVEAFSGANIGDAIGLLGVGSLAGIGLLLKKGIDKIVGFFDGDGATSIMGSIKGIFGALTDTMEAMQNNLKAGTLLKIAGAIALLTVSVIALSLIDPVALGAALGAITVMFGQLLGSLAAFDKIAQGGIIVKLPLLASGLILLSIALGLMTISVVALSRLDWEQLAKGVSGIGALLGVLGLFTQWMSASKVRGILTASAAMILLGAALSILIAPMKMFGDMKWEQLGKGAAAIGGLLLLMGLFARFSGGGLSTIGAGLGLILVATALNMLVKPLQDMSKFSWVEIGKSMTMLAGSLILLALALIVMGSPTTLLGAAALVVGAAALVVLIDPLERMGKLSWVEIAKGMVTLAGVLVLMAVGLTAMIVALPGAIALTVAAGAFRIFMPVFKDMGKMKWGDIAKGLVALAGSLIIMALGLTLMIAALPGAFALTVASVGITALTSALVVLGKLSWGEIWTGLGALALALGVVALAGVLLLPAIPGLLGFAAAITLLGAGIALAGVGILAFTTALTALIAIGSAGVGVVVAFIVAIANTIPLIATKIGEGLAAIAQTLTDNAPIFKNLFKTLITTAVEAITETIPEIVEAILTMVDALLGSLEEHIPSFVDKGYGILIGILKGIRDNIKEATIVGGEIVVEFIDGVAESLPDIIDSGINLIITFIEGLADGIRENSERIADAGWDLAEAIIDGMVNGLMEGVNRVKDAALDIGGSALDMFKDVFNINSPSKETHEIGGWVTKGLANGLSDSAGIVGEASSEVGSLALESMKKSLSGARNSLGIDPQLNPVIKPVMDLTDIKNKAGDIQHLMGRPSVQLDTSLNRGLAMDNLYLSRQTEIQSMDSLLARPSEATKIEYNQTINSPKAVSPSEVYRDTKSLIAVSQRSLDI